MAIEILRTYVAHDFSHDLESFFWLLLWVVLRYTKTTCWPAYRQYLATFGGQTEEQSAQAKLTGVREGADDVRLKYAALNI